MKAKTEKSPVVALVQCVAEDGTPVVQVKIRADGTVEAHGDASAVIDTIALLITSPEVGTWGRN